MNGQFKQWYEALCKRYSVCYDNYEDLLQEAFEAGAKQEREKLKNVAIFDRWYKELDAAVLAEREACADLVENFEYQDKTGRHDVFFLLPHEHVAQAIRART